MDEVQLEIRSVQSGVLVHFGLLQQRIEYLFAQRAYDDHLWLRDRRLGLMGGVVLLAFEFHSTDGWKTRGKRRLSTARTQRQITGTVAHDHTLRAEWHQ